MLGGFLRTFPANGRDMYFPSGKYTRGAGYIRDAVPIARCRVPCRHVPLPDACHRPPRARRYTLGGFYLARYDDSPAGVFDEVRRGACMALTGGAVRGALHLLSSSNSSCAAGNRMHYVNGLNRVVIDHGLQQRTL